MPKRKKWGMMALKTFKLKTMTQGTAMHLLAEVFLGVQIGRTGSVYVCIVN